MTSQPTMNNNPDHLTTPIDEKKKRASEILKRVDQLIKAKELDKAMLEIASAKEIDPSNFYASALEERVHCLLTHTETPLSNKQHPTQGDNKKPDAEKVFYSRVSAQETFHPLQAMQNYIAKTGTNQGPSELNTHSQPSDSPAGKKQAMSTLPIMDMLARVPSSAKKSPQVLMIDDDVSLLSVLSMTITSGGFEVIPLSTSDEAFALLRRLTPDIILCDINLETSTMGGFTFFEKIQEIDRLKSIPFIFLTGLNDDVYIRTGKEMGADDYLTKPITGQNLISTLRGRLKRFDQLLHASKQGTPISASPLPHYEPRQ